MKTLILVAVAWLCCLGTASWSTAAQATATAEVSFTTLNSGSAEATAEELAEIAYVVPAGETPEDLSSIVGNIEPISHRVRVRRNVAQAIFCLPQNVLGILFHGFLQATGLVTERAEMNEVTVVITKLPIGASFGKTLFLHTSLQTENAIRHEYGHTMQGYKRGPFFLLLEGTVSFVQAATSLLSPSVAKGYFERWPENEANALGGITR